MSTTERRDLRIEGQFLPADLGDLIDLRERIVDLIESGGTDQVAPRSANTVADGIVGWLVAKSAGHRESLSAPTRSRYRKVLAALGDEGDGGERGSVNVWALIGAVVSTAAIVGAARRPEVGLMLAPIIDEDAESDGYVGPELVLEAA